jgi:hypothetical protein
VANAITDNRTLVHAADVVTPYDDLSGAAAGTLDTEIFLEGTGSIGQYITSTRDGLLYDAGTAQDWSGNVFYIWINCGIVGLLDTKALGGFRIRFCGATVTDFFEVNVAGGDDWPAAVQGGWTLFVVDIDEARTAALASPSSGAIGGTAPATTAIRYVGYSAITGGTMPRMVDNTWMDAIYRLPADTPGIIVEGRNTLVSPNRAWNSQDIADQLGTAVGTFTPSAGGGFKINTPIQFGNTGSPAGTEATEFEDNNALLLWEQLEFIAAGFYDILVRDDAQSPEANSTSVIFNGGVIAGPSAGGAITRWSLLATDCLALTLNGTTLLHGRTINLNFVGVSVNDCIMSNILAINVGKHMTSYDGNVHTEQATASGDALVVTGSLDAITNCTFILQAGGVGHAVGLSGFESPLDRVQISSGNLFEGYADISPVTTSGNPNTGTGSDSAALSNFLFAGASPATLIQITAGGNSPSVKNSVTDTTLIENNLQITLVGLVEGTEVTVCDQSGNTIAEIEDVASPTDFTFAVGNGVEVDIIIHAIQYEHVRIENISFTADTTLPITQRFDRNYSNP